MTLTINGTPQEVPSELKSLPELLAHLKLADTPLVVEHNKQALTPAAQKSATIHPGDILELVQITAGG